ncbi:MAG: FMN-binding protein [Lentisphaerae bacterium]|jgi:Na+-transporting NADH:ubiquinone oxidoreductase subunit C|nr:FMN-binding protein [Lentisphaerota bacterium]MBT5612682.1 FMN-binding protein [Lentisphaerota bacterium]MBT7057556.1 FMN-binding protein [Lentisphaerota bacterium]MBT7846151.1 FMN-binding protein [Lentisphaerota bacterium]
MKDNRAYTLLYATALGALCATLVSLTRTLTEPARRMNAQAERARQILEVLDVPVPLESSSSQLIAIAGRTITAEKHGKTTLYRYSGEVGTEPDLGSAVAVPFSGTGLWGPIRGFLAIESDMKTIRGVTFHEQSETPGLGGEIAAACSCGGDLQTPCTAWFRHQFKGKRITETPDRPRIRIRRVRRPNAAQDEVDGITGATLTCRNVEAMLSDAIDQLLEER